jgi:subtilase family serine protease
MTQWLRDNLSRSFSTVLFSSVVFLCLGLSSCQDDGDADDTSADPDAGANLTDTLDTADTGTTESDTPGVQYPPLSVEVVADPQEGNAPLVTTLSCNIGGLLEDEVIGPNDDVRIQWTVDGKKSAQQSLEWTFYTDGDYQATCRVWRASAAEDYVEDSQIVRVRDAAELSITAPKIDGASELSPEDCLSVSFDLENVGGRVENPFEVRCVLTPIDGGTDWDETSDSHVQLASFTIDGMEDGQSVTQRIEYTGESMCLPADTPNNQYYLLCKADAADVVGEQNKLNNVATSTTFITVDDSLGEKPDLIIENLNLPTQNFPKNWEDKLSYQLTVTNAGLQDAEKFKYKVYLCGDDQVFDEECIEISDANSQIFSLSADNGLPINRNWTVPAGTADGTYCIYAEADTENVISESNEDNNTTWGDCFDVQFTEILGKDLDVTAITCAPLDAVWDGTVAVEFTVENLGNEASGNFDYEVYLSLNPAPTPANSYSLCSGNSCKNQPSIEAGGTYDTTAVVTIPDTLPLTDYYCIVKLDPEDAIEELDEGNNQAVFDQQLTVVSKAYTDVYADQVSIVGPTTLAQTAGDEIKVGYKLGNADISTAAGATTCIVLSPDQTFNSNDIVIWEQVITTIKPDGQLTEEELAAQYKTQKVILPIELPNDIGEYYVGVKSDCKNVLADDTNKSNNNSMGDQLLQVLNPQGGCFEDDYEENDDIASAVALSVGITESLGMCGDSDFFTVEVPATNSLIVNLNLIPTLSIDDVEFDGDLYLYAADGTLLDQSELTGTQDSVLSFVSPETATYVVQVAPKTPTNESQYTLDLQVVPPLEGIDLFPAKLDSSPAESYAGGALYLNWKTINLGDTESGPYDVSVYLSADQAIDVGDTVVAVLPRTSAAPSSVTDEAELIILPEDLTGGEWNVLMRVDSADAVAEVDETNNDTIAPTITIDGNSPCLSDAYEPNDLLAQATPVTYTPMATATDPITSISGLYVCPDLPDYYAIDIAYGQFVEVGVQYSYTSQKGKLGISILDQNGDVLVTKTSASSNNKVDIKWIWDPGTHYIRVESLPISSKQKPYEYTLNIEVSPGDPSDECGTDQFEPNNGPDNAPFTGCGLKQMNLCDNDQDWLKFELPAAGSVTLTLDNDTNDARMEVYDDPTKSYLKFKSGNGSLTIANTSGATKLYWLKLRAKSTSLGMDNPVYTVFFDGIAGVDLSVENVQSSTGAVYQGEDEIMTFDVINQCLDTVPTMNFGFYLSEDEILDTAVDTLVHTGDIDEPLEGQVTLAVSEKFTVPFDTPAGNYNVIVVADVDEQIEESNEGNNSSVGILEVIEVCIEDSFEPSDFPPLFAPTITTGDYLNLQICPFNLDWYTVDLDAGETLTVTASFVNADGDLDLRLYDTSNTTVPLIKAFETLDGEQLTYTADTAGAFYVRVNGLAGATNAYSLTVDIAGEAPAEVLGCTDDDASNYNANATTDDGSCTYAVDFAVDLDLETVPEGETVYLIGSFDEWCSDCHPMTKDDTSNEWTVTLPLAAGSYEYKFTIGTAIEPLVVGDTCDYDPSDAFANRGVDVVDTPLSLASVCYNSCIPCGD